MLAPVVALVVALAASLLAPPVPVPAQSLPLVSVAARPATEGDPTRVVLTLDRAGDRTVRVRLDTRAVTARGVADYEPVHRVVEIPAGRTRVVVPVATVADGLDEADESFRVRLSGPEHAALDVDRVDVTVADADRVPGVAPQDAVVLEPGLGHRLGFTEVRLSAPSGRRVVVSLVTRPGTAGLADFVRLHPTVVFAPGQTVEVVSVELLSDGAVEGPETLRLVVTGARHARATRAATVTIDDAD